MNDIDSQVAVLRRAGVPLRGDIVTGRGGRQILVEILPVTWSSCSSLQNMKRNWDDCYAAGRARWETAEPAAELVKLFEASRLPTGRALDVGCGTGTNVRSATRRGTDAAEPTRAAKARRRRSGSAAATSACTFIDDARYADSAA